MKFYLMLEIMAWHLGQGTSSKKRSPKFNLDVPFDFLNQCIAARP